MIAAIKQSDWKRDAKNVSQLEFAALKAVAESRRLPSQSVVDGDIVDLNRIRLPADTPIIDKGVAMSRLTSVMNLPKQFTFVFVASIVFCAVGPVYAEETGGPGGRWPKSWPKELEPLRKQASTWEWLGSEGVITTYEIPFANRETFESAWPHILELKSKGAFLRLSNDDQDSDAGVKIFEHISSEILDRINRERISRKHIYRELWSVPVISIELEVDGKIVDLNRIRLPADTPIIDERFKENGEQKRRAPQNAAEQDGAGPPAATTTTTSEGRSSSALDVSDANYVSYSSWKASLTFSGGNARLWLLPAFLLSITPG